MAGLQHWPGFCCVLLVLLACRRKLVDDHQQWKSRSTANIASTVGTSLETAEILTIKTQTTLLFRFLTLLDPVCPQSTHMSLFTSSLMSLRSQLGINHKGCFMRALVTKVNRKPPLQHHPTQSERRESQAGEHLHAEEASQPQEKGRGSVRSILQCTWNADWQFTERHWTKRKIVAWSCSEKKKETQPWCGE